MLERAQELPEREALAKGPTPTRAKWATGRAVAAVLLCVVSGTAAQSCGVWESMSISGPLPSPRRGMLSYDNARRVTVLFSGIAAERDTWEWNGQFWSLRAVTGPDARHLHALTFMPTRNTVVMVGGQDPLGQSVFDDTWEWNGTQWQRWTGLGPGARFRHAMAFDEARSRLVLYGGLDPAGGHLMDTWEWDGSMWSLHAGGPPEGRCDHAMAYDAVRGRVVLMGGRGPAGHGMNDTWEYDGGTWTLMNVNAPAGEGRWDAALSFDRARSKVVLFGGYNHTGSARYGDTWEYDGVAWSLRASSGPAARNAHGMAYDCHRDQMVLFGGDTGPAMNDTWEFAGTFRFFLQPESTQVLEGTSANLLGIVSGPTSVTYQWYRYGAPLVNGGRYFGVTTGSLVISPALPSDSGEFVVVAATTCGSLRSASVYLEVRCYANCDGSTSSPSLNVIDFLCFMNKYAAGDAFANCDGSTIPPTLNVNDFSCFLNRYAAGCP